MVAVQVIRPLTLGLVKLWPFPSTFGAAFAPWSCLEYLGSSPEARAAVLEMWLLGCSSTHTSGLSPGPAGSLALSPPGWVSPGLGPPWPSARLAGCPQTGPPALRPLGPSVSVPAAAGTGSPRCGAKPAGACAGSLWLSLDSPGCVLGGAPGGLASFHPETPGRSPRWGRGPAPHR